MEERKLEGMKYSRRVCAANLDPDASWMKIKDFLGAAGKVLHLDFLKDDRGRFRGTVVAEYECHLEALRALQQLEGADFFGRKITLREEPEGERVRSRSRERRSGDAKVYVGNLHYSVTPQQLKEAFRHCGTVLRADIPRTRDDRSKGFGFITFEQQEEAERAVEKMNNVDYSGRKLTVRLQDRRSLQVEPNFPFLCLRECLEGRYIDQWVEAIVPRWQWLSLLFEMCALKRRTKAATLGVSQYRTVLEVFKWISPKSLLQHYSVVCRVWSTAAACDELWDLKCEDCFFSARAGTTAKEWFRKCVTEQSLPVLRASDTIVFSLPSMVHRTVTYDRPTAIDVNSVYCGVGVGCVLSCGGTEAVYEVNFLSGKVEARCPMLQARRLGGIVRHRDFVYIIGGSNAQGYVQSGEKYHCNSWTPLKSAQKQPRDGFTPFVHHSKLYCVGHWKFIETMDLKSEIFTIEHLQLPHACDHWTVSVPHRGQLVIVRTKSVVTYRLDPLAFVARKYTKETPMYCSNCQPLRQNHHFYYVANCGVVEGVMRLNAESGETVLVAQIDT